MSQILHKTTVQRGLSAHAAIGLIVSALLYIVCLTGTLTVFYAEWQRLEQADAPEMSAIAPGAVQSALAQVMASEKGKPPTTHLYVHMPTADLPRTTITTDTQAVHVDRTGKIVMAEQNAWAEFLLDLHYQLNIPSVIGITIVGILGVMMLALSLTGVIAHPRIFRDAFRLRARDNAGVGLADWHNRLGIWTLPFTLAIATTGAVIALGTVNSYGLANIFYKGDLEAAYAPVFGGEAKPDRKAAPLPNIVAAMQTMAVRFPAAKPIYMIIHDPMTAGQHVQILAEHERRLIYGENYNFDAAGRFHDKTGLSDGALGQQIVASNYNLHFGNYGGLPVKIAYAVFGTALSVMIATGVFIWLGKRERRGFRHPRLRNGWNAIVWGVPLSLSGTLLTRLIIGNGAPLIPIFWTLSALILLIGLALPGHVRISRSLQRLLGIGLLGIIIEAGFLAATASQAAS